MKVENLIAAILNDPRPFNVGDAVEYTGKNKANGMSKKGIVFHAGGTANALVYFKGPDGVDRLVSVPFTELKLNK